MLIMHKNPVNPLNLKILILTKIKRLSSRTAFSIFQPIPYEGRLFILICSSSNCACAIGEGASIITSRPELFFGKAM